MVEAKFFKKTKDGRITCTLCPRYCNLKDGQRGFCFVRQNINGTLYLIAYGKPYAVNVDPIEKKPLFHFLPGSTITSIGTAGCNMACSFCQNYDLSQAELNHQRAIDLPPERVIQMARYHKTESIAYTYNEPTIFVEYVMDTAKLGKKNHLKNVMVTNGYINSEAIEAVYQNIDGANVDLKAFTEKFYSRLTLSHLEPVLETLKVLYKLGIWIEITNLLIPTYNDSISELTKMCEWILTELDSFVPLHFTAFHPAHRLTNVPATPVSTLIAARQRALEIGIKYVYVGNISNQDASSTYCHNCHSLLIQRNWYATKIMGLDLDRCNTCQEKIPGIFA